MAPSIPTLGQGDRIGTKAIPPNEDSNSFTATTPTTKIKIKEWGEMMSTVSVVRESSSERFKFSRCVLLLLVLPVRLGQDGLNRETWQEMNPRYQARDNNSGRSGW